MSKQEITPWFDAETKPVRVGYYDSYKDPEYRWYWNGSEWGWWMEGIVGSYWFSCAKQDRKWRGLTKKAKA